MWQPKLWRRGTQWIENDLWFERLSGIKLVSIWAYSYSITFTQFLPTCFTSLVDQDNSFLAFFFFFFFGFFATNFFRYIGQQFETNGQINWNSFSAIARIRFKQPTHHIVLLYSDIFRHILLCVCRYQFALSIFYRTWKRKSWVKKEEKNAKFQLVDCCSDGNGTTVESEFL